MTDSEKLSRIKLLLDIGDTSEDSKLQAYLDMSADEIVNWSSLPPTNGVPDKYETIQIMSVIAGYNISGAEGETSHNENGINRTFKYADMIDYIRNHIFPPVEVY